MRRFERFAIITWNEVTGRDVRVELEVFLVDEVRHLNDPRWAARREG
jgi:hypothetical protein